MPKALIVELLADTRQFTSELDRAAGKTRQFGKAAGVVGVAIAGGLALGLEKSVKAAEAMQVSTARLDTAFKTAGLNAKDYADQIDHAESSGRNLGFSNIDVRDSLGSLIVATHNTKGAIKDLSTAEDIARFKHIGLADASKVLTMAMAGSQRATKQLGLSLQPVTTAEDKVKLAFKDHTTAAYAAALASAKLEDKQRTAAQVIQLVSDKLHGQASAFADTAQGGVAKMHAQLEALEENLGKTLLPALTAVTGALATATGWMSQHTTVAKAAVIALGALAAILISVSVATKIQVAAIALARTATIAWTAAQWLLNAALTANPIGIVVVALAALAAAIVVAWERSKTFRDVVRAVFGVLRTVVSDYVAFYKAVIIGAIDASIAAFKTVKALAMHLWDGIKVIWNNTIGAEIKAIISLVNDLISVVEKAAAVIHALASAAHAIGNVIGGNAGNNFKSSPTGGGPRGPIKKHAAGGIFTRPTLLGNDLFGEAGPEAIVPLKKGGLGGPVFNITVNGFVGNDQDIAKRILEAGATQLRGGRLPQFQQAIQATA